MKFEINFVSSSVFKSKNEKPTKQCERKKVYNTILNYQVICVRLQVIRNSTKGGKEEKTRKT